MINHFKNEPFWIASNKKKLNKNKFEACISKFGLLMSNQVQTRSPNFWLTFSFTTCFQANTQKSPDRYHTRSKSLNLKSKPFFRDSNKKSEFGFGCSPLSSFTRIRHLQKWSEKKKLFLGHLYCLERFFFLYKFCIINYKLDSSRSSPVQ